MNENIPEFVMDEEILKKLNKYGLDKMPICPDYEQYVRNPQKYLTNLYQSMIDECEKRLQNVYDKAISYDEKSNEDENILKRIRKLEQRLENIEEVVTQKEIRDLHAMEEDLGMSKSKLPPFWNNQKYLAEKAKKINEKKLNVKIN